MVKILNKIFDQDKKYLKRYEQEADEVLALESEMAALSDEELQAKTAEFRKQLEDGKTVESLRTEAFAVVREAARRVTGLFPFKVQIMGALALSDGNIAEMKTGEGKTLTAALPSYLYGLTGKGVHVVTVNEYLATRDAGDIGRIHEFLGLSVGLSLRENDFNAKKEAYGSDITYVTNSELGFDYLRDNMTLYKEQRVIRNMYYALVDEVDSILIDEARTPLIISGQERKTHNMYRQVDTIAKVLKEGEDFTINAQDKSVHLKERGIEKIENQLSIQNLYDLKNSQVTHAINQALRANYTMEKDVDYVVKDEQIVIVDQFTGRTMEGRVFSDGLHQALEAKEGVKTQRESKTLATITYQNFFRIYDILSGMTGTAKTEEEEIQKTYDMDVVEIPTNVPVIRIDKTDLIFRSKRAKYQHIIDLVKERNDLGQPILIGTVSIESSEELSKLLHKVGVKHSVLNAKHHKEESEIIANAGELGSVTIATNMAGRGTDIKISPEVKNLGEFESAVLDETVDAGGLLVIGTERHESRRIDNQLRGRSGRQGDPGESIFYVSLDDELPRRYIPEKMLNALKKSFPDDNALQSKGLARQMLGAQKKIESINFDIRQNVLKYDDVLREQRELMYEQRDAILFSDDALEIARKITANFIDDKVNFYVDTDQQDKVAGFVEEYITKDPVELDMDGDLVAQVQEIAKGQLDIKLEEHGDIILNDFARTVMIKIMDTDWVDHIDAMQILRETIGIRGYGQIDPLQEYQKEGRAMFDELMDSIEEEMVQFLLKGSVQGETQLEAVEQKLTSEHNAAVGGGQNVQRKTVKKEEKVGRNDPCPCGSGKKYKHCHGE